MQRIILILLLLLSTDLIFSQEYVELSQDATSLFGLKSFKVFIEDIDDNLKQGSLNENNIKTDVELKLRSSGINPIPNINNTYPESEIPILYVRIQSSKLQLDNLIEPIFFFHISLELLQSVILDRSVKESNFTNVKLFHVATWRKDKQGYVGSYYISQLRDVIKDLVDKFSNDYLMMNAKNKIHMVGGITIFCSRLRALWRKFNVMITSEMFSI